MRTIYFVVVLCLFSLVGCTKNYKYPEIQANEKILVIGDDFTLGAGASQSFSYPLVLSRQINRTVINHSKRGLTASELSKFANPKILSEEYKLVIIMVGYQDMSRGQDLKYSAMGFHDTLQILRQKNIPVLVVSMNVPPKTDINPMYIDLAAAYENVILDTTIFRDVIANKNNISGPGELNADGYREIAENVEALLRKDGWIRN